jgi:hypothetical protein
MVQLVPSEEDSTSVSFNIWKGDEDVVALGSRTKGECSRRIAPTTLVVMPDLIELGFYVPFRTLYLYKSRNGRSCDSLGRECFPSLHKIDAVVDCKGAYIGDVKKAEAEMRQAAKLHPNQPIIKIQLLNEYKTMYYRSTDTEVCISYSLLTYVDYYYTQSLNSFQFQSDDDDDDNLPGQEKMTSEDVQENVRLPL